MNNEYIKLQKTKCTHPKWELCVHRPNAYDEVYYKKCVFCGHIVYLDENVIRYMKNSSRYAYIWS